MPFNPSRRAGSFFSALLSQISTSPLSSLTCISKSITLLYGDYFSAVFEDLCRCAEADSTIVFYRNAFRILKYAMNFLEIG